MLGMHSDILYMISFSAMIRNSLSFKSPLKISNKELYDINHKPGKHCQLQLSDCDMNFCDFSKVVIHKFPPQQL